MIGWGARFRVSGLSHQEPGSGGQVQVRVQEIRPLSSIQPSFHFRWRVAGIIHSAKLCRDAVPTQPAAN